MKFSKINFSYILLLLLIVSCQTKNETTSTSSNSSQFSPKVKELLSKMTVEEKVGQMTQINLDVIGQGGIYNLKEPHTIDTAKLIKAIKKYHVGSVLNCGGHAYPIEQWHTIINTIQNYAKKEGENQIPILYGIDAIHGANYTMGSTLFPQQLAQAATWNPELVRRGSEVTAYEVRATGIPWNFSPVLDLGRQPLWSRFFETYGEDVYLAKQMTNAAITGYEQGGLDKKTAVASCMKHFLGYSFPFSGKDRTPVYLDEIQLREYYLPTFETAIAAGASTVMINSGELNGIPVHANHDILTKLLRDELGFKGLAVTDWEDIMKLYNIHRVAKDNKEATKMAINAGIDMSMVPNDYEFTEDLIELVNEGEVSMQRIDEAVGRILQLKFDLKLFDNANAPSKEEYPLFGSAEHFEAAYQTAVEAITLLKNESTLPLSKEQKILITGPGANSHVYLNGAWSRTWQGIDTLIDQSNHPTLAEALEAEFTNSKTIEGIKIDSAYETSKAINAAKGSDVIVVCLTETPGTEKPGDIDNLSLTKTQIDYVKQLAKTGKPIVAVLIENRPRIISEIEPLCNAIVMAYQPGDAGAKALTDIISGAVNPSGKLPFTYPKYVNTHVTYDHKSTEELYSDFSMNAFRPQYEFGHGLSYTTFKYENLSISSDTLSANATLEITVDVSNTGDRDGKEVVQCFVRDEVASITPSAKRLRGFQKINLKPGETRQVTFTLSAKDLAFVNKDLKWVTESGTFTISINNLTKKVEYEMDK